MIMDEQSAGDVIAERASWSVTTLTLVPYQQTCAISGSQKQDLCCEGSIALTDLQL